jgi:hypothetical protein
MMGSEPERGTVGGLVPLNLAVLGGGFAWFAYIDASITDGAMLLFAAAVAAGLLSVAAALYSTESALRAAPGGAAGPRPGARSRRGAVMLFLVSLALLLASATLTLNLKGTGDDSQDTQTAAV